MLIIRFDNTLFDLDTAGNGVSNIVKYMNEEVLSLGDYIDRIRDMGVGWSLSLIITGFTEEDMLS